MNSSYYVMKKHLGGEKWSVRDNLCYHWYPTPGCNIHCDIVGNRRGGILFERYGNMRNNKANLMYWRSHTAEWAEIQRRTARK